MSDINWQVIHHTLNNWDFLTAGDVADWLQIPRRKVLLFVEQGIIQPKIVSPGIGRERKFTLTDIELFMVFIKLDKMGVAPRFMRSIATDVAALIRSPADDEGRRPTLLCITQGENDKSLHANKLKDLSEISNGAFLIDLAQIEVDVLRMFRTKAVMAESGSAPRDLLGVLGQDPGTMLESLFDRLVQSSREGKNKSE